MLFNLVNVLLAFVPNSNLVVKRDLEFFTNVLDLTKIPCHMYSARIKTFESARAKLNKESNPENNIFKMYDLIAFRFVFYTDIDLYTFYAGVKAKKLVTFTHNYMREPKPNGYKAYHFHYRNTYDDCPIQNIECQLFTVKNYYEAMYGEASNYKDYLLENTD